MCDRKVPVFKQKGGRANALTVQGARTMVRHACVVGASGVCRLQLPTDCFAALRRTGARQHQVWLQLTVKPNVNMTEERRLIWCLISSSIAPARVCAYIP